MKRCSTILFSILALQIAVAQDVAKFAETDIIGTARYVGMSGAMTAIGGDPTSAVLDNPAGLGLYQHLEASITLDLQLDRTWQNGVTQREHRNYFMPSQFSFVFPFRTDAGSRIVSHNLMFGYNRLKNYNRTYAASVNANTSITDVMTEMANLAGTVRDDYGYKDASGDLYVYDDVWDNPNVGWLTALGYGTDRMQWDAVQSGSTDSTFYAYHLPGEVIRQDATVKETGYKNQFSLDYAMNIDNQWYVGLGLNIFSVDYDKKVYYGETYSNGTYLDLDHSLVCKGAGVSASLGFLGRPTRWLRFGFGLHTPAACTMRYSHYSDATNGELSIGTPENRYTDKEFRMPLRLSLGLGLQLREMGLLSFQYNYAHYKNMRDVHSLRVGGELVFIDKLYLNAGFAYEMERPQGDYVWFIQPTDVRTDTDFTNLYWTKNASVGFGYRGKYMIVQLAYALRWQRIGLFPFDIAEPFNMRTMTHRMALTVAFHM